MAHHEVANDPVKETKYALVFLGLLLCLVGWIFYGGFTRPAAPKSIEETLKIINSETSAESTADKPLMGIVPISETASSSAENAATSAENAATAEPTQSTAASATAPQQNTATPATQKQDKPTVAVEKAEKHAAPQPKQTAKASTVPPAPSTSNLAQAPAAN